MMGQNGILNKATESVVKTEYASLDEEVEIKITEQQIDKIASDTGHKNIGEYLKTIPEATVEQLAVDTWCVTRGNTQITVTEDGEKTEGKLDVWDGTSIEVPEIVESEWKIYTAAQLKFFADVVNSGGVLTEEQKTAIAAKGYAESDLVITDDTVVALMNDIDLGARQKDGVLTSGTAWTPIGPSNALKFTGTFEGNNHTIKGMYVNINANFAGLFGNSDSIQNLTIKDSYIEGWSAIAGISGVVREGYIKNCHNINTSIVQKEGEYYGAGGLVGQWGVGTEISNCSNSGTVKGSAYNYSNQTLSYVGGIVGNVMSGLKSIINCKNEGEISAKGWGVGGICGYMAEGTIEECYNIGRKVSGDAYVGGIAGIFGKSGKYPIINNCYNTGSVTGVVARVGGIIGNTNSNLIISNCYNSGNITGPKWVAGIIGFLYEDSGTGSITNCYSKGMITATSGKGALITKESNTMEVKTFNNLFYLNTVGTGAIGEKDTTNSNDDEANNIKSITNDFNSLEEFLSWVENQ